MAPPSSSSLETLLGRLLGPMREWFCARVHLAPRLLEAKDDKALPRVVVAQALNLVLLARSISEVPDLARYMDERVGEAQGRRLILDHGAVRSVRSQKHGDLPSGQLAFTRFLEPLGYYEAALYPLPALRMQGHAWRHRDLPEDVAQYFVSELEPEAFSPPFQRALERVISTSKDPLSDGSRESLNALSEEGSIGIDEAHALVDNLVACFARQHCPPAWSDYEVLLRESAEMAWISTEGHTFNHATDRVPDVVGLADELRALGRPLKESVEHSGAGSVRQTAFKAVMVWRPFRDADGGQVLKVVPGSFFELISRDRHPEDGGLDLRFDASNAQGIFAMTRR